ncbi:CPBP family intramembrane glutamic endopeptidase [Streptococcus sobrinus]|uniref:CPBP family intramembrane glutamic endopeptidase n=1 Tax=Streptococcus sobrinus TaxID=1310 RepID=UPI0002DC1EA1|nr:CPBP family intramembrane glutamic endopeptidase [Streptococcus sobrinus]
MYFQLLLFLFVAILLMIWVKWVERRSITSLGFFQKRKAFKEIAKSWGFGSLIISLSFALTYLFGGVYFTDMDFSLLIILYVLSLIPFWFIQSGTEELLTRGWLLPLLNRRFNLALAVGVSSGLFGLMHLLNAHVTFYSILCIILSGIVMTLYALKRDNIWGVSGLHVAWNFMQGNIFGIAVSGQEPGASLFHFSHKSGVAEWISGGAFGTEGSLLTSFVLLLTIIFLLWQLRLEKRSQGEKEEPWQGS